MLMPLISTMFLSNNKESNILPLLLLFICNIIIANIEHIKPLCKPY